MARQAAALTFVLACLAIQADQPAPLPFQKAGLDALLRKDYAACAAIFGKATKERWFDSNSPMAAARCRSRMGDQEEARRYLKIAFERGYRKCASFAESEEFAKFHDEFAAACNANEEAFLRSVNSELLLAFEADQSDRAALERDPNTDVDTIKRHDLEHQKLVREMMARRLVKTADDYYHAAMIMQHGARSSDFETARSLAKQAVDLRPWFAEARWLYAAATDRYLQSTGKPQIFGTQYRRQNDRWTLEPFDPNAITDEERARWQVPSLRERLDFIAQLNAQSQ